MKSGVFIIPSKFHKDVYVSDRYHYFFESASKLLNYNLVFIDDVHNYFPSEDIVILFKCPQDDKPDRGVNFSNLNSNQKLVLYYTDISPKDKKCISNTKKLMYRADLILCSYNEAFLRNFGEFKDKYIWFPHYVSPTERYSNLPVNDKIVSRCLVVGMLDPTHYNLRMKALCNKDLFDIVPHPGHNLTRINDNIRIKDAYAKEINRYFCCLSCTSKYKYAIAKSFEIPAAGTLLISDSCKDLYDLGFIPDVNYVEVNEDNIYDKVSDIINNHKSYLDILIEGRNHVLGNYTLEHALFRFKTIIEIVKYRR